MANTTPVTKCPKCGYTGIELAAFTKAKLDDLLTCPSCGKRSLKSEFTAEIVNKAAKLLQDAFRNAPGFKPK